MPLAYTDDDGNNLVKNEDVIEIVHEKRGIVRIK